MFEFIACSAALALFAALWFAVYKLGGLDWTSDKSLAGAHAQLAAANFGLDGEVHGASARLSPVAAQERAPRGELVSGIASQARLSVPAIGWNA
jgi:hypothetical protein